jgi:5-methylcytosine-specific restriction protein A
MRREFSAKVRLAAYERANGHCEVCTAKLFVGRFAYDHIIPDALGGEPTLENCHVVCTACHGEKTTKSDVPTIAKSKRVRAKHAGIKTGRPMPGSRASGWKRHFDGTVSRRNAT